jgi:hypothetical protein
MHEIMDKKFYLDPKFGTLSNKEWITISELLQSPSVYKASARRNMGHNVAREVKAASPLTGGKFVKLLRCPCVTVSVHSNHHRE